MKSQKKKFFILLNEFMEWIKSKILMKEISKSLWALKWKLIKKNPWKSWNICQFFFITHELHQVQKMFDWRPPKHKKWMEKKTQSKICVTFKFLDFWKTFRRKKFIFTETKTWWKSWQCKKENKKRNE